MVLKVHRNVLGDHMSNECVKEKCETQVGGTLVDEVGS